MSFLRKNSLSFLKEAERNLNEGEYNLAMFHLEQALQLALKFVLYERTGTYEKTHNLIKLLEDVIRITNNDRLRELLDNESSTLDLIQQAYIGARYLPYEYSKNSVIAALRLVRVILNELGLL
ncbi:HEPN domain-containing protein [Saccharolobus caldissimus]|uniref:DNA-binding protein n=1 Tax=Saccharolobus caldissimus TaxID=1702097 RepID=A0AAQ4CUM4_9CREN|nr:HEPN domain-containing protein [Saccharolobus caldissimus]BDB99505.1 DNA-binding protein [Saccharolobus caldissimus]